MSKHADKHKQIIEEILAKHDLSHDFGRKAAYEEAIEFAREHLAEDPDCNEFLQQVAQQLGFAPITFDTIESRVKLRKGAWLDVWIADEYDEVAFTGTKEGIQYLIDLLTQLRNSTEAGEHIHLDRGYPPMTDNSAHLVLFKEEEDWFTGPPEAAEPYPPRELTSEAIFAFQVLQYPPEGVPMTPHVLYRVLKVARAADEDPNVKDFPDGAPDRYHILTFRGDNGHPFSYGFHLDDPEVNYFTHREIMSLVMQKAE